MSCTHGRMRKVAIELVLALGVGLLLLTITATRAAAATSWQFAPAEAPDPPSGVSASSFPEALGTIGDIEFWSPNEGLLITGGTEATGGIISAGLYAYDGTSWHELSDVCGSAEGKIAYVSADEWWTISDQRPGLSNTGDSDSIYDAISLCHFIDGEVVASYALPVDESDSWPEMDAAVCEGADDCWFAGGFSNTTDGAFHLYWNGSTLTEVDDTTEAHAVSSMALDGLNMYESVTIGADDTYSSGESTTAPSLVHTIVPTDTSDPFHNVLMRSVDCTGGCPTLPQYGTGTDGNAVVPDQLAGLTLSSDAGSVADPSSPGQIWALAEPVSAEAHPIVLRYTDSDDAWNQIVPNDVALPSTQTSNAAPPDGIAAVPGQDAAWLTVTSYNGAAEVEELTGSSDGDSDGDSDTAGDTDLTWSLSDVQDLGPDQDVGDLGAAGPISCPAANDCWLATDEGWLFHWTDDASSAIATEGYSQSTDPVYNGSDGVITYRPADDGTPDVAATTLPDDDSLANQAAAETVVESTTTTKARKEALVSDEKAKLIKGTDKLRFTFKLRAKARVQLLALRRERVGVAAHGKSKKSSKSSKARKGKVKTVTLARSRREVLKAGRRSLIVKLSPRRWPTSLKLNASVWKK